ncbi:Alkaline phosphatase like protein [Argiope bruennichi]|uniref:alkaline phosphatase n=1 Tax=Argiope bruennichi TaxID=94029 RepID=A0A8T0DYK0_ARGBR|nr:Alkaline phosphatase like protein [Argiope bruennichi]
MAVGLGSFMGSGGGLEFSGGGGSYLWHTYRHHWYQQAKAQLMKNLRDVDSSAIAKNIILFIGDGMGLTTVTTARILRGQQKGHSGEEYELAFDKFQHVALAKTYNTDSQVGDSGACATALLCGVKGRFETVGLDDKGVYNRCESSFESKVFCLADWAQTDGKSTGLVTTTRVTHPKLLAMSPILATVIFGGGRRHFLPRGELDTKNPENAGRRKIWAKLSKMARDKKSRGLPYKYVSRKRELDKVDPVKVDYLLGLFSPGHMAYESDRDNGAEGEPSIAQMTRRAIEVLRKNPRGYFLMVEGGRIDHSHHFNNAHRALVDTLAFEDAVITALGMTRPDDTLMVVTSDHSHVFAFGGYPKRGNPIFGVDDKPSDVDNMPYTTLLYANGPGYNHNFPNGRENLTNVDTEDKNFIQQSAVPRRWDSHGGEDVPVYAHGPMAHLFRGVFEQTYVPHALAFASCIGPQRDDCERRRQSYHRQLIECPSPHIVEEDINSVVAWTPSRWCITVCLSLMLLILRHDRT